MKFLNLSPFLALVQFCGLSAAYAQDICKYSVSTDQYSGYAEVRVDMTGSPNQSWAHALVNLQDLPLKEGFSLKLSGEVEPDMGSNDSGTLTYHNGVLTVDQQLRSNFSHDVFQLAVSPDLKEATSASYSRTLSFGVLLPGSGSRFSCEIK